MSDTTPKYTEADLRRIVNEKIFQQRLEFLENEIVKNHKIYSDSVAKMAHDVESMRATAEDNGRKIVDFKEEIKKEIGEDFMSKPEGAEIKASVKMISFKLWMASITIIAAVTVMNYIFHIMSVAK